MAEALRLDDDAGRYTYADYLTWPDEFRCELIGGQVYGMSPAPSKTHQRISLRLATALFNQLEGHRCEVFDAPFDVRLPEPGETPEETTNVLQPDVFIVCDAEKAREDGVIGAPDFVVEILSPSTRKRDLAIKLDLYERHGVREYWIIDPVALTVTARVLGEDGRYGEARLLDPAGVAELASVPGLKVDLARVLA